MAVVIKSCAFCRSTNVAQLRSELALHIPKNIDKSTLFLFPDVFVCRDCGHGDFAVSPNELNRWLNSPLPSGVNPEPGKQTNMRESSNRIL